jgi:peptide/nickel transport system substrate-binding protein
MRALTRQLFSYRAAEDIGDPNDLFTPVPDVALAVPSEANGGLDESRCVHTIRLRRGVRWNTALPREMTAQDFVRGLKRIASPVVGADARRYFTSTILGMAEYCDAYDAFTAANPGPAEVARFQNSHEIAGVRAADDKTLVITLREPANDFLNILATGFASAAPAEYDAYLPDTRVFRRSLISCGPYRVARELPEAKELVLEPNPAWTQRADPIRRQYVDAIHVRVPDEPPDVLRAKIDAGEIDLAWPFTVVSWRRPAHAATAFQAFPGFTLNPYLAFNLQSPNAGGATQKLKVRQAIAYAIDKTAIGSIVNRVDGVKTVPLHSVLTPGSVGQRDFNLYPTEGDRGDPVKARALLAEAGCGDRLELLAVVRDVSLHLDIMRSIARDLEKCGIHLAFRTCSQAEYYGSVLSDPRKARAGAWDLAEPGWTPDWYGNNGRTIIQPLFHTDRSTPTANYGCYSSPTVDRLIRSALQEADPARAESRWHDADVEIMQDVPVVPLLAFACQSCAGRGWATAPVTWWASHEH